MNTAEAAFVAAAGGAGIARVFSYQMVDLPRVRELVMVLEAYEPPPRPVHLIYPGQRHVPLKLRAFLGYSIPRLRTRLGYKPS